MNKRENINPVNKAKAYSDLRESRNLTYSQLSKLVNCPISHLKKYNAIHNLSDIEKQHIVKHNFGFDKTTSWIKKFSEDERLKQISGQAITNSIRTKTLFIQSDSLCQKIESIIISNQQNKQELEEIKKNLEDLIDLINNL